MVYTGPQFYLKDECRRLTTALLITVVSAVVVAVANRPLWHAAVVGLAVKLCVVVTAICRSHCGEKTTRLSSKEIKGALF